MMPKTPDKDTNKITHIDDMRIRKLREKGHIQSMIEEYEILRLKFLYEKSMTKQEAVRLVTLCKYFMDNGPSESFRYSCKLMYQKYMEGHKL